MPDLVDYEVAILDRFSYDPVSGSIIWTKDLGKARMGSRAEVLVPNGYLMIRISVDGKRKAFMAHRVAYFLQTGGWPLGVIDHIDSNKVNNKWTNLRDCTQSQNLARRTMKERDLPRGVAWVGRVNKKNPYIAQIANRSLGYFLTPELASKAYEEEFIRVYGEEWRH